MHSSSIFAKKENLITKFTAVSTLVAKHNRMNGMSILVIIWNIL